VAQPDDLSFLPPEVAATATVEPNGEVRWPLDRAEAAINALADSGRVVVGLDLREYDEDGRFIEIPWTTFEPSDVDDVEEARVSALTGLQRAESRATFVLITWRR
jgi:hypothetical protein